MFGKNKLNKKNKEIQTELEKYKSCISMFFANIRFEIDDTFDARRKGLLSTETYIETKASFKIIESVIEDKSFNKSAYNDIKSKITNLKKETRTLNSIILKQDITNKELLEFKGKYYSLLRNLK